MKIELISQRRDDKLTASKVGDVITVNGEVFDFSALPDGATIPNTSIVSKWFFGDVSRVSGELEFALFIPRKPAPPETLLDPADGQLAIPSDPIPEPIELELPNE